MSKSMMGGVALVAVLLTGCSSETATWASMDPEAEAAGSSSVESGGSSANPQSTGGSTAVQSIGGFVTGGTVATGTNPVVSATGGKTIGAGGAVIGSGGATATGGASNLIAVEISRMAKLLPSITIYTPDGLSVSSLPQQEITSETQPASLCNCKSGEMCLSDYTSKTPRTWWSYCVPAGFACTSTGNCTTSCVIRCEP
jgi:hypothetical protein